jgi:hypothetical protein
VKTLVGLLAVLGTGCLNVSRYGTPRTTPVGEVQHSLSGELIGFRGAARGAYRQNPVPGDYPYYYSSESGIAADNTPTLPSYGLRVGVTERIDFGLRLPSFAAIDLDLKWNFARSAWLDAALEPGVAATYYREGHFLFTSPLVLGINPSPDFSIVPAFGLAYSSDADGSVSGDSIERLARVEAGYIQAGLGLDFRFADFSVHPEMSTLRSFVAAGDADISWYTFGIGFGWGARPVYPQP